VNASTVNFWFRQSLSKTRYFISMNSDFCLIKFLFICGGLNDAFGQIKQ